MNNKNLLEDSRIQWTSWFPLKELSPEFFSADNKLNKLRISTHNNPNVYGKFMSSEICISGSQTVIFDAEFSCKNVQNEEKSISVMVSFYNNQKAMLERNYADIIHDGKTKKFYRKLKTPEETAYAILEIGVRWCPNAVVEWDNMSLAIVEDEPPRIVRIATTYKEQCYTLEENLNSMIDIINKAGESNPDIILLSELVYESCYNYVSLEEKAQPVPGPLTNTIGGYAKKYNTYITFTMNEKIEENGFTTYYNTAVVIGRDGKVCGKYRKTHLPLSEAESGTSPGNSPGIFDLDFGRIGIIICYDQYFLENSRALALMGAEIIFIPTMGEDELIHRAIARSNGVYVTVSGYRGSAHSRIINPLGEIVNFVKDTDAAYAVEEVDLNKRFFTYWMSIGPGNGEDKVLFQKERMIENYGAIVKEVRELR